MLSKSFERSVIRVFLLSILLCMYISTYGQNSIRRLKNYVPISEKLHTCGQITGDALDVLKKEGVKAIISVNAEEFGAIESLKRQARGQGIDFVNVPVSWEDPTISSLEDFFEAMDKYQEVEILVHCQLNWRASAYVYLYRTIRLKESKKEAQKALRKIWNPEKYDAWNAFFKQAEKHFSEIDK